MRKILMSIICASVPLQVLAINKCEVDGKIIYTAEDCQNGQPVKINPPPPAEEVLSAQQLAARLKAESGRLQAERLKRKQQEDTEQDTEREQKKKCAELEQGRLPKEDVPGPAENPADKGKKSMPTAAERFAAECKK